MSPHDSMLRELTQCRWDDDSDTLDEGGIIALDPFNICLHSLG